MLATSTMQAASMLDLARNKLRNNHATSTEKGAQHPPSKNTELVARFFVDEDGKLLPRVKVTQPHRRAIFCSDCAHYLPSPALYRSHGEPLSMPGGCLLGRTTPDAWPPIYPFTGWLCAGWASQLASIERPSQRAPRYDALTMEAS